jgi:hypothetical protein
LRGVHAMPTRLSFNRFGGVRLPENARLITRPSRFGNPFAILKPIQGGGRSWQIIWSGCGGVHHDTAPAWFAQEKHATRAEAHEAVVELYRRWLLDPDQAELLARIRRELRGRDVACSCPADLACHGDVMLELANS